MIGIKRNIITVKDLYDYAVLHNYVNSDVNAVLDIINREKYYSETNTTKEYIIGVDTSNTTDFSSLVEYSVEDVLNLFSS